PRRGSESRERYRRHPRRGDVLLSRLRTDPRPPEGNPQCPLVRRASTGVRRSRRRAGGLPYDSTIHGGRSRGGDESPVVRAPAPPVQPLEAAAPGSPHLAAIAESVNQ